MTTKPNHTLAYALGDTFAAILHDNLEPAQRQEVRRRNAARNDGLMTCASHDFCDANMVMLEAFTTVFGREPVFLDGTDAAGNHSPEGERDLAMVNAAWALAKLQHLTRWSDEPTHRQKLTAEYAAWVKSHGYDGYAGDAEALCCAGIVTTPADAAWLVAFIEEWDAMEEATSYGQSEPEDEDPNPCQDRRGHSWVCSDENEEISYCERCGQDGNA